MKTDLNSSYSSYFNEDLENPKYLYLGATEEIDFNRLRRKNLNNANFMMHLTSHYNSAVADAFMLKMTDKNVGRDYELNVNNKNIPILEANNINDLDDNEKCLLYIFECPEDAKYDGNYYFKVDEPLIPVKVKELIYRDHKMYYSINKSDKKIKCLRKV